MPEQRSVTLVSGVVRKGVPFTVYFSAEQAQALANISRDRRVSKATVVRFAVERLLEQIESGQLELPLGV
jgi:predicted DNA-binding protein